MPPPDRDATPGSSTHEKSEGAISVVIPYYNEERFLPATLASLALQQLRPFTLILVNNASTDGSPAIARAFSAAGIRTLCLDEPTPGQVHALAAGIAAVRTPYIAICDADTFYPPHYLAHAARLLDAAAPDVAGYIAHNAPEDAGRWRARLHRALYTHVIPHLLPMQAHGGGYAHVLRTDALRAAGGYAAERWPYVLKDHELAHRLMRNGRLLYDENLWCVPSARRGDRRRVRWTLFERIAYHATPPALKDWFWYDFLRARFERRHLRDTVLRQQSWNPTSGPNG